MALQTFTAPFLVHPFKGKTFVVLEFSEQEDDCWMFAHLPHLESGNLRGNKSGTWWRWQKLAPHNTIFCLLFSTIKNAHIKD